MQKWMAGVRGTLAMVALWTVGWGLGFGGIAELLDPHGRVEDVWPAVMGITGLIAGIVFTALFRSAEGDRAFDRVPLARFARWGVATGLVLGVFLVLTGLRIDPLWVKAAALGIGMALCTVAAVGSAVFFRLVARRRVAAAA
jgi:hypothetical protein